MMPAQERVLMCETVFMMIINVKMPPMTWRDLLFWKGSIWKTLEFSEDLDETPVEKVEVGTKVVDSLKAKSHVWVKFRLARWFSRLFKLGLD